ncbi:MAG: hypothetical protein AAGB22_14620, partial [Bacteroidota bacterium]
GHFVNSDLHKVDVNGNGQTIYFTREEDRTLIGVNKTVCSDMIIWVDSNQVKRIKLIRDPQATLTPWSKSNPKELLLPDFRWRGKIRPQKREDIFVREEEGELTDNKNTAADAEATTLPNTGTDAQDSETANPAEE